MTNEEIIQSLLYTLKSNGVELPSRVVCVIEDNKLFFKSEPMWSYVDEPTGQTVEFFHQEGHVRFVGWLYRNQELITKIVNDHKEMLNKN